MADSGINAATALKIAAFMILVCPTDLIFGKILYSIPEELELGAFIGNIAEDLRMNVPQLSARKLRLVTDGGAQFMKVNLNNGIVSVGERIDREHICGQEIICNVLFEIILENPLSAYRGVLKILDVNDNSPTFQDNTIVLQIAEAISPGVLFPLENAEDLDAGVNTIIAYTISSSEYFSLRTQSTEDGMIITKLLLEKPLDREIQSSFRLILTAIDGGSPQKSGTAHIHITVVDINDNPPLFDPDIYRGSLLENALLGTLVMKVKAIDLDEGTNADLTYSLSKLNSERTRELFNLDPHTGEIRLEGTLDFEETQSYSLNVQAVDHGSPAMFGDAKVLIKVIDVNDNAPEVKVTSATNRILENVPPGTLITLINVIDRDSGVNGQFHCEVPKRTPFRLQSSSKNHYELITNEPLDREGVPEYKVIFVAWDLGSPSLSTNKTIQIVISDVNDNAPMFGEPSYNIYVMENNTPGASVFSVTATDADLEQNSYISYSFLEIPIHALPVSPYLSINSMNGTIYALHSFDYEKLKNFQIHVQARDAGVPPLSSSVAVNVIILDQNDNAPIIVSASGQSGLEEVVLLPQSSAQGYLVAKILATDADSGQNARLFYHMVKSTDSSLFNVGQNSGEITTSRAILQRDTTTHTLVILVKDNGQPSLSSISTIHISVLENITERNTLSSTSVANSKHFHDLNLYLIVLFACTSILFLLTIILLIGIKCKQDRNITQQYNSPRCSYKRGDSNDTFNLRPVMEETLRYPGTGRIARVSEAHNYSVCLSPESAKSDFLFLKPCTVSTPQAQC